MHLSCRWVIVPWGDDVAQDRRVNGVERGASRLARTPPRVRPVDLAEMETLLLTFDPDAVSGRYVIQVPFGSVRSENRNATGIDGPRSDWCQ
jgi:hypothetical protein